MLTRGREPRAGLRAALTLALLPACLAVSAALPPPAMADQVRTAQGWVLAMLDLPAAWQVSRGAGVTVAVIDSGVDGHVSDLAGSVTQGPNLTGVATRQSNPHWGQHGTWMASLIAGHGHDGGGSGILGAAPASHVLSIRVITDPGDPGYRKYQHEPTATVQKALARAIGDAVSAGAGVISMSIGYGGPSFWVRSALKNAYNHNVVVVASAGNSGRPGAAQAPYSFPADYPGVIAAGAVDASGAPAAFSSDNLSVAVAAPGVDVPAQGRDGAYWLVSGTSPACALTAGVAALIRSAYPRLPAPLVAQALTSTTRDRPPGGYDPRVGFGTVDAAAALAAARRLSADPPARAGLAATTRLGGAIAPPPVARRGPGRLIVSALCALAALILLAAAAARLAALRKPGRGPGAG